MVPLPARPTPLEILYCAEEPYPQNGLLYRGEALKCLNNQLAWLQHGCPRFCQEQLDTQARVDEGKAKARETIAEAEGGSGKVSVWKVLLGGGLAALGVFGLGYVVGDLSDN